MSYASNKNAWGICDECGWRYRHRELRKSSYGTLRCPTCFDGEYDLKNHPQNYPPASSDDPQAIRDPRPDVSVSAADTDWDISQSIYTGG